MDTKSKEFRLGIGIFVAICGTLILFTNISSGINLYLASLFGSNDAGVWEIATKGAAIICIIGGLAFGYMSYFAHK